MQPTISTVRSRMMGPDDSLFGSGLASDRGPAAAGVDPRVTITLRGSDFGGGLMNGELGGSVRER
ncbi:MAG: hypothetical protein IPI67_39940 [Myxococcales bacterium]|nr:hypothetical protein [Myxococcales bacterium]